MIPQRIINACKDYSGSFLPRHKAANGVGPTVVQLDAVADPALCDQPVVAGIAVDLQATAKALQYPLSM